MRLRLQRRREAVAVLRAVDGTLHSVVVGAAKVAELERRALASGQVKAPVSIRISPDRTVEEIDLPLVGKGDDAASMRALELVRGTLLPQTVGSLEGVEYATTGVAAATKDFNELMKARLPLIFAFVLGAFMLIFFANVAWSWVYGQKAGANPWRAKTLEWTVPTPVPIENFEKIPVVVSDPYTYGQPEEPLAAPETGPAVGPVAGM